MIKAENEYVRMWIENGVFYIYNKTTIVDLDIAMAGVKLRHELCQGITYPLFSDSTQIERTTKDARNYLVSEDGIKFLTAGAFLIKNPVQKIIGNFWVKIEKPILPVQLFTNQVEAIEWLSQFKSKV